MSNRTLVTSVVACLLAALSVLLLSGRQAESWRESFSPRLLEPSGAHDVGVRRTRLDTGADDPWNPGHSRVLMVDIHYPAAADEDRLGHYFFAQYMTELGMLAWAPDHERRLGLHEDEVNWLFRTHSREWAPPRDGSFPVVVIPAPSGAMRTSFTTLAEDLASHGIVTVTVDHPYAAPVVELWPTREVIEAADADRDLTTAAAVEARAADVAAVAHDPAALDEEVGAVMASGCVFVVPGDLLRNLGVLADDPMVEAQISARYPRTAAALGPLPSVDRAEHDFRVRSAAFRDALAERLARNPGCPTATD